MKQFKVLLGWTLCLLSGMFIARGIFQFGNWLDAPSEQETSIMVKACKDLGGVDYVGRPPERDVSNLGREFACVDGDSYPRKRVNLHSAIAEERGE